MVGKQYARLLLPLVATALVAAGAAAEEGDDYYHTGDVSTEIGFRRD